MGKRGKSQQRYGKYAPPKGQVELLALAYGLAIPAQLSPMDRLPLNRVEIKGMEEGLLLLAERVLRGKRIR